jgi:uncharacterized protein (DUF302 family)
MYSSSTRVATLVVVGIAAALSWLAIGSAGSAPASDGVVRVNSVYDANETVARLKADIEKKGITFFLSVDQAALGANAGITLNRSTLLIFGNPPLGIQFLTANPNAGLDWPVRLLVTEDDQGHVWAAYTDFGWIAQRHGIKDREEQFKMASEVIASITSSVTK